jgi:hypothetical protein
LGLRLLFLDAADVGGDSGHVLQRRGSTSPITCRGSPIDLAVAISARKGPVIATLSLIGTLASRPRMNR